MGLYKRKDSSYWWIKHTHKGHTIYQSTKTTKKAEADLIWADFLDKSTSNCLVHRKKTWDFEVLGQEEANRLNQRRFDSTTGSQELQGRCCFMQSEFQCGASRAEKSRTGA